MHEPASSVLGPWSAFYTLIGASSATLIGLMFIVVTLVAGRPRVNQSSEATGTFSTPTVVHFGAALLLAAILLAPWRDLIHTSVLVGLVGAVGTVYAWRVILKTKRLDTTNYTPDVEDFAWYNVLPFVAYGAILLAALATPFLVAKALIALAAGTLLLVFIGIRNAWDVVTFIAVMDRDDESPEDRGS